jgi:BirA family biotin operon repressor/biotin-[acetyl-CoA-carboxylase] ligase
VTTSSLSDRLAQAGHRAVHHASIGSTMTAAMEAARGGEAGPLWIIADEQTSGRGRQGRGWMSPAGNLHATLLLVDPCEPARAAELGFVAGLALHDAASLVSGSGVTGVPAPQLALKWPNDLLLDGAKCAGLLLEGSTLPAAGSFSRFAVAIGFGVNIIAAPTDTPYPATCMPAGDRDALMQALVDSFTAREAQWRSSGLAPLLAAWRSRAAFLGQEISLRLPDGATSGRFEDIDAKGRLKLLTGQGLRVIDAGDLFFPAAS